MKSTRLSLEFIKTAAVLLCFIVAATFVLPIAASANSAQKTVRVGWYESSFNTTDKSGRRSGYAYEYQLKIAAYTGWKYTYVTGSWSDLMQMLIDGKTDLLSVRPGYGRADGRFEGLS